MAHFILFWVNIKGDDHFLAFKILVFFFYNDQQKKKCRKETKIIFIW